MFSKIKAQINQLWFSSSNKLASLHFDSTLYLKDCQCFSTTKAQHWWGFQFLSNEEYLLPRCNCSRKYKQVFQKIHWSSRGDLSGPSPPPLQPSEEQQAAEACRTTATPAYAEELYTLQRAEAQPCGRGDCEQSQGRPQSYPNTHTSSCFLKTKN